MFDVFSKFWNLLKQTTHISDYTSDIEYNPTVDIVEINSVEFFNIKDIIDKNISQLPNNFIVVIESHPGPIGSTVILKISDGCSSNPLIEENVTDHNCW